MRKRQISYAAAALLLATPLHGQDPTARIDSIFGAITPSVPGCVVGVAHQGRPVATRAYGLADVEGRVALSPRSRFDIGSTQKQFVAAAVLLLVEDGKLALDDDIHRYFPELPDYGHPVTVDQLLTHTSGVRDWVGLLPMAKAGSDVLELILRQPALNFEPGTEWLYSNSGYVLLKELVGRVSGKPFAEFARQRLFQPLGMESSSYESDILQGSGPIALAYEKEGDGWKKSMRLGNERAGGAVITTAGDLLKWNEALTTGRLGKFVTAKLQEPARLDNGRTLTYARGLMLNPDIPGGPMISHSGSAAGYSTWLGRFMAHELSVAVLCNFEPVSATALAGRVADLFLPPVDPNAKPGPVAAQGVDVSGRDGLFFEEGTGEPLQLVVNSGRLGIVGAGPLVPVSGDRFRPQRPMLFFRSEDDFELRFVSADELELKSMEGETTRYRRAQPWTPADADLRSLDGRYRSDDLGTVFEILPGANGRIVWRFEETPEKAVELQPVARDTWMLSRMVMRFRRDASGKVTGIDYSNPGARNMTFTRLGERKTTAPAAPAADAAPAATAPKLESLVGEYEMAPGRIIAVTLENGQLYGEPTANPKRPLLHVSGTTFSVGEVDAPISITFTLDAEGRATSLVMRQNGRERTLQRVR